MQICFTDGVFEINICEINDKHMAEMVTNLLNEAYENGLNDGELKYLKEKFPEILRENMTRKINAYKRKNER